MYKISNELYAALLKLLYELPAGKVINVLMALNTPRHCERMKVEHQANATPVTEEAAPSAVSASHLEEEGVGNG